MSKWIVDIHGDIEGDYEIIRKYEEPKKGKWINDKCSVCGKGIEDLISSSEWYRNEEPNFCPFCGIKLVMKECKNCKHYGEDLHGTFCRFCQDMKLWEIKE